MQPYLEIRQFLQDLLPEALEKLRQMVAINSFTANAEGVNRLGELTADLFTSLGFQPERVQSANSRYGKHLFLKRPGGEKMIAMVSHLDTVFAPQEEIEHDFRWREAGEKIYGPGTVDIKGGTVMIWMVLEALRRYAPQVFEQMTWLICLDATEETLSEDFGQHCLDRMGDSAIACLVFEGGTPANGKIPLVTARKGRATYVVRVEGRSAHAGNNHAQGANAIVQMAHTVQKIAALTDYEKQLTFNVGTVQGGVVVNRVPHSAEALVEMRTFLPEVFDEGVRNMLALDGSSDVASANGFACRVQVELRDQSAPWPRNPGTEHLLAIWKEAGQELGLKVGREERGGLSDGNLIWRRCPTLDGLGPAGANAHCSERSEDGGKDQEYVLASTFVPRALLNVAGILKLVVGQEKA